MSRTRSTSRIHLFWLLPLAIGAYWFFAIYGQPINYSQCDLCDSHEYAKVYTYFEKGHFSQVSFPYYMRPLVPYLASLYPGSDIVHAFHSVNFVFMLLGVVMLFILWRSFDIPMGYQWIGFAWLSLHWVGLIRYNLADYISIDVPLYAIQALGLYFFIRKRYHAFYWLTPLALLQKESFLPILLVLIAVAVYHEYKQVGGVGQAVHLVGALALGILFRIFVMDLMPPQADQRLSIMTIFSALKLLYDDPLRIIRLFTAVLSAFGLFPVLIMLRFNRSHLKKRAYGALYAVSMLFVAFGILAGEDMTRIVFLGFPFIMTLSLLSFQNEHKPVLLLTIILSLPVMHLMPIPIDIQKAVDFAPMVYVFQWAIYFVVASSLLALLARYMDKKSSLEVVSKTS